MEAYIKADNQSENKGIRRMHQETAIGNSGAAGVTEAQPAIQHGGSGATPTAALHSLRVIPIPIAASKVPLIDHHYLHSLPAGTAICLGVFKDNRLHGALTFGAGASNAYRLVKDAKPEDCLTLTRLWLSDDLLPNSESRVLAVAVRALRKHSNVKFLVTYADPSHKHVGTIYQATNWLYIGLTEPEELFDLGDGKARHTRSLGVTLGTRSKRYFESKDIRFKTILQQPKHRYIYFLDPTYTSRLKPHFLPYPKRDKTYESS